MRETSKARDRRGRAGYFHRYLKGQGIDVGCGDDPLEIPEGQVVGYDRAIDPAHDAERLTGVGDDSFDFVYSSNCLEHLHWPERALLNWLRVVQPGGYVFFSVPDEDLYEQGNWPSKYNPDHKTSWTIYKPISRMPQSISMLPWLMGFTPVAEILSVQLVDTNYDHAKRNVDQTLGTAEAFIEVILRKRPGSSSPIVAMLADLNQRNWPRS